MRIENSVIANTQVVLDGNEYVNVQFKNCQVVYAGGMPPLLQNVSFDHCDWKFAGAAELTLIFMSQLYNAGAKPFIEEAFDHIRLGT